MIKQIPVELPKSFEKALGYSGDSRWVAFYWEPCGDEAMYDDGVVSGDGNWWGYKAFVDHLSVSPWLADYDLGSSDNEAKHWLLCDRETREVYVGEKKEIVLFLRDKVKSDLPESPQAEFSPEEIGELLTKLTADMKLIPTPSMAEIEEKMRRDQEAVEKMVKEMEGA